MIINNNIPALNTYRYMTQNNSNSEKVMEKLSSGLRINRAADDAAGLAISEKMKSQIRGLGQAERNILDGVSLIQTAEGGLNEIHSKLQRVRELTLQGVNDTLVNSDREKIQKEIKELKAGINQIANNTQFNERALLNVDYQPKTVTYTETITTYETITQSNPVTTKTVTVGAGERVSAGYVMIPDPPSPSVFEVEAFFGNITGSEWPDMNITSPNGETFGYRDTYLSTGGYSENQSNSSSSNATYNGYLAPNEKFTFENPVSGKWQIDIRNDGGSESSTFEVTSNYLIHDEQTSSETTTITVPVETEVTKTKEVIDEPIKIQTGANAGEYLELKLTDARTEALGIHEVDITETENAADNILALDNAISYVSTERAMWGSYQNRLDHIYNNVANYKENITRSQSAITDADMALKMTEYTKHNILNQSATAMLAQANQLPQGALQLLG